MRNITFFHVLILFVGSFATCFYLNYQTKMEMAGLKQAINNQNFFNSVLLDEVTNLKSKVKTLNTDVLIGQAIGVAEISFANTKINNIANDCQNNVNYINELIISQNSQFLEPSLATYSSSSPEGANQKSETPVLPDAMGVALNVGLKWMNVLAGLNSGMTISEYYTEKNNYARRNIFWPAE